MTQTNTTQNRNAINRIIERTDEITKRELSGNDPSYKIGDNPNEFYQNGTLPVQNASTQPTTQNKEELSECLHEHLTCPGDITTVKCAYCGKSMYKQESDKWEKELY
jgi:hypothetical protein